MKRLLIIFTIVTIALTLGTTMYGQEIKPGENGVGASGGAEIELLPDPIGKVPMAEKYATAVAVIQESEKPEDKAIETQALWKAAAEAVNAIKIGSTNYNVDSRVR